MFALLLNTRYEKFVTLFLYLRLNRFLPECSSFELYFQFKGIKLHDKLLNLWLTYEVSCNLMALFQVQRALTVGITTSETSINFCETTEHSHSKNLKSIFSKDNLNPAHIWIEYIPNASLECCNPLSNITKDMLIKLFEYLFMKCN